VWMAAGNVYIATPGNCTIRKNDPAGVVTTIAGMPGLKGTRTPADGDTGDIQFPPEFRWATMAVSMSRTPTITHPLRSLPIQL